MDCRKDIADLMSLCVGCGRCREVCTSHRHGGCDPTAVMQGDLSKAKGCLTCGLCNDVCEHTVPKKVMMYAACIAGNVKVPDVYYKTGYNLPPAEGGTVPVPPYCEDSDDVLMPGCLTVSSAPFLEYSAAKALELTGIHVKRFDGGCCTYPIPFRSMTDSERNEIKHSKIDFTGRMYNICPGCRDEMASVCETEHIIEPLHRNIEKIKKLPGVKLRVASMPGCGLRHQKKMFDEIVEACGCIIEDTEQGCCGKAVPKISEEVMKERQDSMKDADAVIVGCPSCFARYDGYKNGVPVLYIAELVCLAAGDRTTSEFHKNPIR